MIGTQNNNAVELAFLALVAALIYYLHPVKDDWVPLDLVSNQFYAAYLDKGSVEWAGSKVDFSIKVISKDGEPFRSNYLMPDHQKPRGGKEDMTIDCAQQLLTVRSGFIFVKEGVYVQVPSGSSEADGPTVLGEKDGGINAALLSICKSQTPGLNPFKYSIILKYVNF